MGLRETLRARYRLCTAHFSELSPLAFPLNHPFNVFLLLNLNHPGGITEDLRRQLEVVVISVGFATFEHLSQKGSSHASDTQ